jgi:hypothetical protein
VFASIPHRTLEVHGMSHSSPDHDHGPDEPPDHGGGHGGHDGPAHDTIEVEVITTAKDLDRRFNLHQPLRAVFEQALELVGGHANADQFVLEYRDEPLTELEATLGELKRRFGWGRRVELEFVPKPVVV